jgi:hypothetical protein
MIYQAGVAFDLQMDPPTTGSDSAEGDDEGSADIQADKLADSYTRLNYQISMWLVVRKHISVYFQDAHLKADVGVSVTVAANLAVNSVVLGFMQFGQDDVRTSVLLLYFLVVTTAYGLRTVHFGVATNNITQLDQKEVLHADFHIRCVTDFHANCTDRMREASNQLQSTLKLIS